MVADTMNNTETGIQTLAFPYQENNVTVYGAISPLSSTNFTIYPIDAVGPSVLRSQLKLCTDTYYHSGPITSTNFGRRCYHLLSVLGGALRTSWITPYPRVSGLAKGPNRS